MTEAIASLRGLVSLVAAMSPTVRPGGPFSLGVLAITKGTQALPLAWDDGADRPVAEFVRPLWIPVEIVLDNIDLRESPPLKDAPSK